MATPIRNKIDPDTQLQTLEKSVGTTRLYDVDCSKVMRSGETINAFTSATPVKQDKVSGSSNITTSELAFSGTTLQLKCAGGTNQEDYRITCLFTTSGGDTLSLDVMLHVRNSPAD